MVIVVRISGEVNGVNTVFCEEKHCMLNCKSECIPHHDLSRFVGVYRNWSFKFLCTQAPRPDEGRFNVPKANLRLFAESFFFFQ